MLKHNSEDYTSIALIASFRVNWSEVMRAPSSSSAVAHLESHAERVCKHDNTSSSPLEDIHNVDKLDVIAEHSVGVSSAKGFESKVDRTATAASQV